METNTFLRAIRGRFIPLELVGAAYHNILQIGQVKPTIYFSRYHLSISGFQEAPCLASVAACLVRNKRRTTLKSYHSILLWRTNAAVHATAEQTLITAFDTADIRWKIPNARRGCLAGGRVVMVHPHASAVLLV